MQKPLSRNKSMNAIAEFSKNFKNYMKIRIANATLKLLTNNMKNGILSLYNETLDSLKEKHPDSKNANNNVLLTRIPHRVLLIMFTRIDKEMIKKASI